jgi:hypothetical protein
MPGGSLRIDIRTDASHCSSHAGLLPGAAGLPGCYRVLPGVAGYLPSHRLSWSALPGCCRVLPGAAGCCRVAAGCCRVAGLPGTAGLPGCCRVVAGLGCQVARAGARSVIVSIYALPRRRMPTRDRGVQATAACLYIGASQRVPRGGGLEPPTTAHARIDGVGRGPHPKLEQARASARSACTLQAARWWPSRRAYVRTVSISCAGCRANPPRYVPPEWLASRWQPCCRPPQRVLRTQLLARSTCLRTPCASKQNLCSVQTGSFFAPERRSAKVARRLMPSTEGYNLQVGNNKPASGSPCSDNAG